MINQTNEPEAWAHFITELEDAHEHLSQLLTELCEAGAVESAELSVGLGHIYAHLNRAWYRHRLRADFPNEQWPRASAFPSDLEPVG